MADRGSVCFWGSVFWQRVLLGDGGSAGGGGVGGGGDYDGVIVDSGGADGGDADGGRPSPRTWLADGGGDHDGVIVDIGGAGSCASLRSCGTISIGNTLGEARTMRRYALESPFLAGRWRLSYQLRRVLYPHLRQVCIECCGRKFAMESDPTKITCTSCGAFYRRRIAGGSDSTLSHRDYSPASTHMSD